MTVNSAVNNDAAFTTMTLVWNAVLLAVAAAVTIRIYRSSQSLKIDSFESFVVVVLSFIISAPLLVYNGIVFCVNFVLEKLSLQSANVSESVTATEPTLTPVESADSKATDSVTDSPEPVPQEPITTEPITKKPPMKQQPTKPQQPISDSVTKPQQPIGETVTKPQQPINDTVSKSTLSESERLRAGAVQRLFDSERRYLQLLTRLRERYLQPLTNDERVRELTPQSLRKTLFTEIELLRNLHLTLITDLLKLAADPTPSANPDLLRLGAPRSADNDEQQQRLRRLSGAAIGRAMAAFSPAFKLYASYLQKYADVIAALESLIAGDAVLAEFIADINNALSASNNTTNTTAKSGALSDDGCSDIDAVYGSPDLQRYLSVPTRRLSEYIDLLQAIRDVTPQSHPDHLSLAAAIVAIQETWKYTEEKRVELKKLEKLLFIQKTLGLKNLVTPNRRLVLESPSLRKIHNSFRNNNSASNQNQNQHQHQSSNQQHSSSSVVAPSYPCDAYLFNDLLIISRRSAPSAASNQNTNAAVAANQNQHQQDVNNMRKSTLFSQKTTKIYHLQQFTVQEANGTSFALIRPDGRQTVFVAGTREEQRRWLAALKQIVDPQFFSADAQSAVDDALNRLAECRDSPATYYPRRSPTVGHHQRSESIDESNAIVEDALEMLAAGESPQFIEYIAPGDAVSQSPTTTANTNTTGADIRCATLEKLIQILTNPHESDTVFLYTFFLTYKSFTTPATLLQKLIARYNTPPLPMDIVRQSALGSVSVAELRERARQPLSTDQWIAFKRDFLLPVRLRICHVLSYWMQKHSYDFRDTRTARQQRDAAASSPSSSSSSNETAAAAKETVAVAERLRRFIEAMKTTNMEVAAPLLRSIFDDYCVNKRDTFTEQQLMKAKKALEREKVIRSSLTNSSSLNNNNNGGDGRIGSGGELSVGAYFDGDVVGVPKPHLPRSIIKSNYSNYSQYINHVIGGGIRASGGAAAAAKALSGLDIVEWPSNEIARQLTLIDFEIFARIQAKECLNQSWNLKNKSLRQRCAPNIHEIIQRTNNLVHWITYEIVKREKLKDRVHALKKFIKTADACRKLGNFNTAFGVMAGVNSIAVHRLRKTWDALPANVRTAAAQLSELSNQERNYKAMRTAVKAENPPCLPYVGLFLTDLTFIEDGNDDIVNGKINLFKRRKLSVIIRQIQTYQQTAYKFAAVYELMARLRALSVPSHDEDYFYEMSLRCEQRASTS